LNKNNYSSEDQHIGSLSADPCAWHRINKPRTVSCLTHNAHHLGSNRNFRWGLRGQIPPCSLSPLRHWTTSPNCFYTLLLRSTSRNPAPRNPPLQQPSEILDADQQKAKLPKNPLTMTAPSCTDYRSVATDPSCHSFSTNNVLLPTTQMQSKSPQTHIPLTDPHTLFYLPINLRLGPLKSLITPRHHPP
jgi:hypothetical protein